MITLEVLEADNIIRMITISESTPYLYYLPKCKKPLPFDHINQKITLSLITLSGFHCNIALFLRLFSAGTHKRRFSALRRRSTSKRRKFRETLEGLLRLPRGLGNLLITVQWHPLNRITLGQRQTDSYNRLIIISELASTYNSR